MRVSSPEVTILDPAAPRHGGGLSNAATVAGELLSDGRVRPDALVDAAGTYPVAVLQRVGWILDRVALLVGVAIRTDEIAAFALDRRREPVRSPRPSAGRDASTGDGTSSSTPTSSPTCDPAGERRRVVGTGRVADDGPRRAGPGPVSIDRRDRRGPLSRARARLSRGKLHLSPALRYSEDLDYVRRTADGIGEDFNAVRAIGERFGMQVRSAREHPKAFLRAPFESGNGTMRVSWSAPLFRHFSLNASLCALSRQ